jgi:hypothetical protein
LVISGLPEGYVFFASVRRFPPESNNQVQQYFLSENIRSGKRPPDAAAFSV